MESRQIVSVYDVPSEEVAVTSLDEQNWDDEEEQSWAENLHNNCLEEHQRSYELLVYTDVFRSSRTTANAARLHRSMKEG